MLKEYNVGVVGASGAVGEEIIKALAERGFPIKKLVPLASKRSAGKVIDFLNEEVTIQLLTEDSFKGLDIAFFAAGGAISEKFAPIAVKSNCVVIDNSSFFRMEEDVPLIVPEVNPNDMKKHKGIISNPNCSTIQMLVALKPIYDAVGIKRIIVSTYQAVSGTGQKAIDELAKQTQALFNCEEAKVNVYPHRIAFNCLPHIDSFLENGYTKEEMKMVEETKKIFNDKNIKVTATCVRVPVFYGHSESIWIETKEKISPQKAKELLRISPGILVVDEPSENKYPLATEAAGRDEVFIGRIREDISHENGLTMWVVADNLRKGAAVNAVEIGEFLIRDPKLVGIN